MIINETQTKILSSLAEYKYLTTIQLLELGVCSTIRTLYHNAKGLKEGKTPFVLSIETPTLPKKGKLPSILYLSRHGAQVLVDDLGFDPAFIRFPKSKAPFSIADYDHRIACVNFHIALKQWADENSADIELIHFYFDKTGNNRIGSKDAVVRALTRIELNSGLFIVPDVATVLNNCGNKQLFLFEMINGKDTKRALNQIFKHQLALTLGTPSDKYDINKANRVLFVFEREETKNAVLKRLSELPEVQNFQKHLFFNTLDNVRSSFASRWQSLNCQSVKFENFFS